MKEPLLFNTLEEAAQWLSIVTGDSWTPRAVLNAAITTHRHEGGRNFVTLLQGVPPSDTEFGLYGLGDSPLSFKRSLGWLLIPISLNEAKLLLARGDAEFSYVGESVKYSSREEDLDSIWVMPIGSTIRLDTSMLGISGNALKTLAGLIENQRPVPSYVRFAIGAPPKHAAPVEKLPSLPPPEAPAEQKSTPKQRSQEDDILSEIARLGHKATELPKSLPGKAGVKAAVRSGLKLPTKIFNLAWERLRADGRIADATLLPQIEG